jgi:hypothetical protein
VYAEGLVDVDEGSLVSFMWKRNDLFYLSEVGEVWEGGIVYWDARSSQTCHFEVQDSGDVKAKYVKLFVQLVPVGPDGLPTDFGATIASGHLNMSSFVQPEMFQDGERFSEHEIQIPLKPSGRLDLKVCLQSVGKEEEEDGKEGSQSGVIDCATPTSEYVDGHVKGTPILKKMSERKDVETPGSSTTLSSSLVSASEAESGNTAADGKKMTPFSTMDESRLNKKVKKLSKQCEEARARAFSEASVALQRGIEIDNLKRAKDVLMRRLESAEQQLMLMMKQELSSTIHQEGDTAALAGMDSLIQMLAETKVALAEKEFEAMELQGKLRAREAHIESLTVHLDAIREKAELDSMNHSQEIHTPQEPSTHSLSGLLGAFSLSKGEEQAADVQPAATKTEGITIHVNASSVVPETATSC